MAGVLLADIAWNSVNLWLGVAGSVASIVGMPEHHRNGWLTPEGSFIDAEPTPPTRMRGLELGQDTVRAMDQALCLVNGSFVAAAKLLSMSPQRFRNLVRTHATLRAKWGKGRGSSGPRLPFRVEPHVDCVTTEMVKDSLLCLTEAEREQVRDWIEWVRCEIPEPVSRLGSLVTPPTSSGTEPTPPSSPKPTREMDILV